MSLPERLQNAYAIDVKVAFDAVELFDNEQDGTFTGDICFILYKGNHYHLTIDTDWGEKLYVDTQDVWDLGDHVGITIQKVECGEMKYEAVP